LDNLAAETAAYLTTYHPDYAILAARIVVSNLHKETKKQFSTVVDDLYHHIHPKTKKVLFIFVKNILLFGLLLLLLLFFGETRY